ncbi:MAG: hypothetical protein AB1448_12150 [Pseudomonadota bacterium]
MRVLGDYFTHPAGVVGDGDDLLIGVEIDDDSQRALSLVSVPEIDRVIHQFAKSGQQSVITDDRPEHPLFGCSVDRRDLGLDFDSRHD